MIALRAFFSRIGLTGAIIAVLALLLVVQTVRIEGFKVWPVSIKGLKVKLADARAEIKRMNDEAKKAGDRAKVIAKDVKDRNDEQVRIIYRDAAAVRVRGPGKAVCPRLPAPAGGSQAPAGKPDAPGPAVPPDDRAAVPWNWLVDRAQQCDLNRAEALSWREWYDRISKEWPSKANAQQP